MNVAEWKGCGGAREAGLVGLAEPMPSVPTTVQNVCQAHSVQGSSPRYTGCSVAGMEQPGETRWPERVEVRAQGVAGQYWGCSALGVQDRDFR